MSVAARIIWLLVASVVFSSQVYAFDNSGDWGGGCCGVPPEQKENAIDLISQFRNLNRQVLEIEQVTKTICANRNCGLLNEETASLLLNRYWSAESRTEEKWLGRLSVFFTGIAVVIAWLAHRQSTRNEVEIGRVQGILRRRAKEETK